MESKHHVKSETPHMLTYVCTPKYNARPNHRRAGAAASGSSGRRDVGRRRQADSTLSTAQRPGMPSRVQAALRSSVRNLDDL
jgi:hypothetical protein